MTALDRRLAEQVVALRREMRLRFKAQAKELDDVHRDVSRIASMIPDLLTRADYEPRHAALTQAHDTLASRVDRMEGSRAGSGDTIARILSVVAALAAIASVLVVVLVHG